MSHDVPTVVRLLAEPGPNGFWPRENYFEGGAENGYALTLRPARALALAPGAAMQLEVANQVPHLPYVYEGAALTIPAGGEVRLVFTWGGRVLLLDEARIASFVQHAIDPAGSTESPGPRGLPLRQQGARGAPLLYAGELVPA